jgi:hypothetical protein
MKALLMIAQIVGTLKRLKKATKHPTCLKIHAPVGELVYTRYVTNNADILVTKRWLSCVLEGAHSCRPMEQDIKECLFHQSSSERAGILIGPHDFVLKAGEGADHTTNNYNEIYITHYPEMRSLLKALYIITPSHWPVLSNDLLNNLGSIQPSCSSKSVHHATQTQIPFLPASYPFNTWVR